MTIQDDISQDDISQDDILKMTIKEQDDIQMTKDKDKRWHSKRETRWHSKYTKYVLPISLIVEFKRAHSYLTRFTPSVLNRPFKLYSYDLGLRT